MQQAFRKLLGKSHLQALLLQAIGEVQFWGVFFSSKFFRNYCGSSISRVSVLQQCIGEVPLWGVFFCIKLKAAFVASSYAATSWEIIGIASFWHQSIGEFPPVNCISAASYWGRAIFWPSVVSRYWGFPLARLLLRRSSSGIPNCLRFA